MSNLRSVVAGLILVALLVSGIWLVQLSSTRQKANHEQELAESGSVTATNPPSRHAWTVETSIGTIVADSPQTARVLELVGIDYCCGGQTSLGDAANAGDVDPAMLLNALMVVGTSPERGENRDWQQAEIGDLIDHIVSTHHAWLRRELPLLSETTGTVLSVHGDAHPELAEVTATLGRIHAAILPHLDEEENHLFPALRKLADGKPTSEISDQLEMMRTDHDALGQDLHRLRELTSGFAVPEDACAMYREMLTGLVALERDLHRHVHLENNVLLPKATGLLAGISKKRE